MDRVMRMLKTKYAEFKGRARRKEYWYFVLFQIIAQCAALVVDSILFGGGITPVYTLVGVALLVPALAVGFRRMHDIDRSAWWLLIGLIPLLGWIILIYWFAQPGTKGPNRFGPDPIEEEEGAAADAAAAI
jgi:uncharacterized membrane protein YhaH (DUF805 family)